MRRAFALGFGLLFAWTAGWTAAADSKIPDRIENRTFRFRISNPERRPAMKSSSGDLIALRFADGPDADFVTVNVEDLSRAPDATLESYRAQLVENLRRSVEGFEIRRDDRAAVENFPAHELIYAGRLKGRAMRWKTLFTLKDRRAYVLTYAADDANYFKYLESADKILYSFRFL